jgi:hypothetical protein
MKYTNYSDLIAGQYYVFYFNKSDNTELRVIFKYGGRENEKRHYIDAGDKYKFDTCCRCSGYFVPASPEDIEWLDDCIAAGKTVPRPTKVNNNYEIF